MNNDNLGTWQPQLSKFIHSLWKPVNTTFKASVKPLSCEISHNNKETKKPPQRAHVLCSRCFNSSIKLLSELQVHVLELISGSKEKFPLLSLDLGQALTQLPEQRPPAAGQPQGTQEIDARLAA